MATLTRFIARSSLSLLLGAAPVAGVLAAAQTAPPESVGISAERLHRIDELVQRNIDAGEISGAVTLVARNGQIVHLAAHGVMDVASKKPMSPTRSQDRVDVVAGPPSPSLMPWRRAVRLSDLISKDPRYADADVAIEKPRAAGAPPPAAGGSPAAAPPQFYTVPAARQITVLDVLTHTSGVMSGALSNSVGNASFQKRHEVGLKWVEPVGDAPLEFQPGSRWSYSAVAGFDILSRIVEVASGQSFDQYLAQRIFQPLGMQDATFWPGSAQRARLVTAYQRRDGALVPNADPDSMSGQKYFSGAGGIMATAESYAQFGMMLANGGALNGKRLLSPRTIELMGSAFIPDTLPGRQPGEGYGLGVRVITSSAARGTWLSAGSFGWSGAYGTHFWVDPSKKLVAVLMAQTPNRQFQADFENAVMQALVD
jgi:CubicO group peptidase (beta-lactamase class C family)